VLLALRRYPVSAPKRFAMAMLPATGPLAAARSCAACTLFCNGAKKMAHCHKDAPEARYHGGHRPAPGTLLRHDGQVPDEHAASWELEVAEDQLGNALQREALPRTA
jgi:hypothetical protein